MGRGEQGGVPPPPPPPHSWEAHTYWVSFPKILAQLCCPVEGCLGGGEKPDQPLGSSFTPPRAGHNCDTGGGEPNLPQMPQMQHVYLVAGSKWPSPLYIPFLPGRGAEGPQNGGRGDKGGLSNCSNRLHTHPNSCPPLQTPWYNTVVIGWRLVGGGAQTLTGAEEVGAADTGVGEKISICPYVGYILHCGVKGGYFIWVGDVGYATAHREDLGRIPPQGGLHIDREATTEGFVWDMVVPPAGGGDVGVRPTRGGDLRRLMSEHSCTVHYD